MGGFNETVGTINTTLRTLLMLLLVGAAGVFGYKGYEIYNQPRQQLAEQQARLNEVEDTLKRTNDSLVASEQKVGVLETEVAAKQARIDKLDLSLRLIKVRNRMAQLKVLEQRPLTEEELKEVAASDAEATRTTQPKVVTRIEFVEISSDGTPLGEAREFDILGDMIYLDYLQVTFSDQFVEEADLERSTAIALFNRIFGEYQEPVDGFRIDQVGTRPVPYDRGNSMSEFERKIWDDFWVISNDPKRASDLGIHAAHGEAVAIRAQPGMTYEIELRAAGGMTIKPTQTPTTSDTSTN